LDLGALIHGIDDRGKTALHVAAGLGHLAVCKLLAEKVLFTVDMKDESSFTPLHHACVHGKLECALLLIKKVLQ
jgi:CDK inhibitor PHO81